MAGNDLSRKTRAAKIAMPFKFPLGPENMPEVCGEQRDCGQPDVQ